MGHLRQSVQSTDTKYHTMKFAIAICGGLATCAIAGPVTFGRELAKRDANAEASFTAGLRSRRDAHFQNLMTRDADAEAMIPLATARREATPEAEAHLYELSKRDANAEASFIAGLRSRRDAHFQNLMTRDVINMCGPPSHLMIPLSRREATPRDAINMCGPSSLLM